MDTNDYKSTDVTGYTSMTTSPDLQSERDELKSAEYENYYSLANDTNEYFK